MNAQLSLESSSKRTWVVFFCAVKRIINTSPAFHKLIRQEYSVFLDWIYYHECLAEFTVRHWHVPYEGCGFAPIARSPRAIEGNTTQVSRSLLCVIWHNLILRKVENSIGCPIDVLQLLVHTCRLAIVSRLPKMTDTDIEKERSKALEKSIFAAVGGFDIVHLQSATPPDRNTMVSDLHRVACMLYVNRTVHRVTGTEFRHRRLVREGILLLTNLGTCQHAWPLFIIACEAVDDNDRLAILEVFDRTLQDWRRRSNHVHFIQHLVEAVWSQHDLDTENKVDYLTTFDAVIGAGPFMPLFA